MHSDMCLIDRPLNEEHPGGRASGSSAGATGQHAAGRRRGGPGEGRRGCCCCVCCHQLRRDVTWQLAWALRLQKQVEPDSQYLPHWAGEVWAGTVSQQETSADIARTSLLLLKLLAWCVNHWHVRSRVELLNFSLLRNTLLSLSCRSNHSRYSIYHTPEKKTSSDDVRNVHSNLYPLVCWHSFCCGIHGCVDTYQQLELYLSCHMNWNLRVVHLQSSIWNTWNKLLHLSCGICIMVHINTGYQQDIPVMQRPVCNNL